MGNLLVKKDREIPITFAIVLALSTSEIAKYDLNSFHQYSVIVLRHG
jgi:hypothetical protein